MKRLLQIVVVGLVGLLLVPPSVAEGLCFMLERDNQANMPACCTDMQQMTTRMDSRMRMADSAQAQSCNEDCCSISRPIAPSQTTQDKLRQSGSLHASSVGPDEAEYAQSYCALMILTAQHGPTHPLHILLRTIRI